MKILENNSKISDIDKKISMLKSFLFIEDNIDLFLLPQMKSILRINKINGESKIYSISSIINNPQLNFNNFNDLISLGIIKFSINGIFRFVSVCDIRHSYSLFKNPETTLIQNINCIISENILYISYISPDIVQKKLSIKEYSLEKYKVLDSNWEIIKETFEGYNLQKRVFFLHRNSLPDCIAICNENSKNTEFISIEETSLRLKNSKLTFNTDLSTMFPIDRIIDLNQYKTPNISILRIGNKEILKACSIKKTDNDEIDFGYDKKNNALFYIINEY